MYKFVISECTFVLVLVLFYVNGIDGDLTTYSALSQQISEPSYTKDYLKVRQQNGGTAFVSHKPDTTTNMRRKTNTRDHPKIETLTSLTKAQKSHVSTARSPKSPVPTAKVTKSQKLPISTKISLKSPISTISQKSPLSTTTSPLTKKILHKLQTMLSTKSPVSTTMSTEPSVLTSISQKLPLSTTTLQKPPVSTKTSPLTKKISPKLPTTISLKSPTSLSPRSLVPTTISPKSPSTILSKSPKTVSPRSPVTTTISPKAPKTVSPRSPVPTTILPEAPKTASPRSPGQTTISTKSPETVSPRSSGQTTISPTFVSNIYPNTDAKEHNKTTQHSSELSTETSRSSITWIHQQPDIHSNRSNGINVTIGYSMTSSTTQSMLNSSISSTAKHKQKTVNYPIIIELTVGVLIVIAAVMISVVIIVKRKKRTAVQNKKTAKYDNTVPYNEFDLDVHSSQLFEEMDGYEASFHLDSVHKQKNDTDKHSPYDVLQKIHVETGELEYDALTKSTTAQHEYVNYHDNRLPGNQTDYANTPPTHKSSMAYANYNVNIVSENVYENENKVQYANIH